MNWTEYILGIIAAAIILPLLALLRKKLSSALNLEKSELRLEIPSESEIGCLPFKVLHVGNSRSKSLSEKRNITQEYQFSRLNDLELVVNVKHEKNRGFAYKCFVEHDGIPFEDVMEKLNDLGFEYVSKGGKGERAWFIIPKEDTVQCDFLNNYHHAH